MNDKNPAEPTAEQLLKTLDLQLAESRKRKEARDAGRTTFRITAIVVILLGTAAAFGVLLFLLDQMRDSKPPTEQR